MQAQAAAQAECNTCADNFDAQSALSDMTAQSVAIIAGVNKKVI